jgi:hypothetical protein
MLHQRERNVRQLTIAAGTLGAIAHAGDGSTLSLYRLD